jgi:hypothetical protein
MRPRANSAGRRSAWTWRAQKGEAAGEVSGMSLCVGKIRHVLVRGEERKYVAIGLRIAMVRPLFRGKKSR